MVCNSSASGCLHGELDMTTLRRQIGVVWQESSLQDGTFRQTVAPGHPWFLILDELRHHLRVVAVRSMLRATEAMPLSPAVLLIADVTGFIGWAGREVRIDGRTVQPPPAIAGLS